MNKPLWTGILSFLILISAFLFANLRTGENQEAVSSESEYVPNEVLVKFKNNLGKYSIQNAVIYLQGRVIDYLDRDISPVAWDPSDLSVRSFRLDPYLLRIKLPSTISIDQAIEFLNSIDFIEYAEKNAIFHACAIANDPWRNEQYALDQIKINQAWDINKGSEDVVVAVIDSGVNGSHEDFVADNFYRIWKNEDEIPDNGIDDDDNGYTDDYLGWNFCSGNDDIYDYSYTMHGTKDAGIIGARTDNGKGIAAVDWNAKVMILTALNPLLQITGANAIKAIDYATENGAKVCNNSYARVSEVEGDHDYSTQAAIVRAMNAGVLFIASAGNVGQISTRNNDVQPVYPASHDIDNVISVAYTNSNDKLDDDSHIGLYSVDLAAPGRNIVSCAGGSGDDSEYGLLSGTSPAAPHVAGVAALLRAKHPSLHWWKIKTIIMNSVDSLESLDGMVLSGGRLNAYKALSKAIPVVPSAPSNLNAQAFGCDIRLTWTDNSDNETGFYIYRKGGPIYYQIGYTGPNQTTFWDYELPTGTYSYYVRAYKQVSATEKTYSLKCPVKSIKLTGC